MIWVKEAENISGRQLVSFMTRKVNARPFNDEVPIFSIDETIVVWKFGEMVAAPGIGKYYFQNLFSSFRK